MTRQPGELRVAILTNFIPPYRLPVFQELARRAGCLRIFISTPMEADRSWAPEFGGLDVHVQKTFTRTRSAESEDGLAEAAYTHFPVDTVHVLSRYRPDVVISGEFGFRTLGCALYRAIHRNSRLIIWATLSENSERHRGPIRRLLRRLLLRSADAVMVNGASGRRYIERFGFRAESIYVVPQTADVNVFASIPLERDSGVARRLLYVGRLVNVKRVRPFFQVLARWAADHPANSVDFRIAGGGPRRKAIEAVHRPPNLQLAFLGDVSYGDLPRVYAAAGVLVFPSDADEWGVVVNEAMASGLPVLGCSGGEAVAELVEDGWSGWVFPSAGESILYEKLTAVFASSDAELDAMRRRARARALQLTPAFVVDRMIDAIRFAETA